jgi:hypothetical protein
MERKPSLGDIVHYVSPEDVNDVAAGVVVHVTETGVEIQLFSRQCHTRVVTNVPYSQEPKTGHWRFRE